MYYMYTACFTRFYDELPIALFRKAIPVKEEHEYMDTVRGGLTGGMVYSNVGDPIQMDKNPAYESTQVEEGDTEGEYAYIPTGVQEESTNL